MTTPTDPFYGQQWHFNLIGDIETVWDEYSGNGVSIGVYDDGIDVAHEDLVANYDSSLEVKDGSGSTVAPTPETSTDGHGTSVAGLIAAANNGTGVVGVAHGASLTGVNIFGENTYGFVNADTAEGFQEFLNVISQATNFDIMNNSWGSTPLFNAGSNLADPSSGDYALSQEYGLLSQNGRDGLGTVILQAAGNDNLNANGDRTNASRFTITVAATDINGDAADFSNFGQSVLVAAPAGSVTTDLTGSGGYNSAVGGDVGEIGDNDYTQTFGGTSAATPITSGVVALMLEANGDLGWRDIQNLLASSATLTGSGFNSAALTEEDGTWFENGAGNWNGGGMHFHVNYGYGMIDVLAAVRMAEAWSYFDAPATSANEVHVTSSQYSPASAVPIPDDNDTGISFNLTVSQNIDIEHIGLVLDLNHTWIGDLQITLTSPSGTTIVVNESNISVNTAINGNWYFGIDSLLGENAFGTWTVNISDQIADFAGSVQGGYLDIYGSTTDSNDVYTYTNEISAMLGFDPSRVNLSDTNGGNDWLNMAAITSALDVNLATNGSGRALLGGQTILQIASGSVIENIHAGDGNDSLVGNSAANELVGARGDDTLFGGTGEDTLIGGVGDDRLLGNENDDRMFGNEGRDYLNGGGGSDKIYGGYGADEIVGGNGNDTLYGNSGSDLIKGSKGDDTIYGGNGRDTLEGGSNNDLLEGQAGKDVLSGGDGNDTLKGGNGHDKLSGDDGNDTLYGGSGNDTLLGNTGDDFISADSGNDTIFGGGGNDTIDGGTGNDRMDGGSGADTFQFSTPSFGQDTIRDFNDGVDMLDFSSLGLGLSDFNVITVGSDVLLELISDTSQTVLLENISAGDIDQFDFV